MPVVSMVLHDSFRIQNSGVYRLEELELRDFCVSASVKMIAGCGLARLEPSSSKGLLGLIRRQRYLSLPDRSRRSMSCKFAVSCYPGGQ